MTKMQIIAKTVLTVLGIHIIITLCSIYLTRFVRPVDLVPILAQALFCSSFVGLVALATHLMVVNNDALALKMAGPGQEMDRHDQMAWLTKSFRTGLVFTGLMLLPGFIPKASTAYTIYDSLPGSIFIYTKAILTLYLLCGAPHFVSWQTRRSLRQITNTEETKDLNSYATSPERTPQ